MEKIKVGAILNLRKSYTFKLKKPTVARVPRATYTYQYKPIQKNENP